MTPAGHRWFPIGAGTAHEYGSQTFADGAIDCSSCHTPGGESFTSYTCIGCHAHEETSTRRIHTNLADFKYESEACYACHRDSSAATAGAAPAGLFFEPSQSISVTALIPRYAATSITEVSPQLEVLPMEMDHASTQISAAALADCSNCHANASSGTFLPGLLHSGLANLTLPQPASCDSCHGGAAPTGFVGPAATMPPRLPATGEMKHDAVAWVGGAPGTIALVPADCGVCHTPPSQALQATWSTGTGGAASPRYHANLDVAPRTQPGSCLDCHANSRPAGLLTSGNSSLKASLSFDHGAGAALGDCSACHTHTTDWTGGQFHAAGSSAPATCLPCHATERPTSTAAWSSPTYSTAPFDYGTNATTKATHGAGLDCVTCHGGPGTGGVKTWVGGSFDHGPGSRAADSCVACHLSQRPDLVLGAAAAKAILPNGFDHSIDGAGDCVGCHQATVTAKTYARYFNGATGTLPNGDWKGALAYPAYGSSLDQSFSVTEYTEVRSGALVTSLTQTTATYFNGMLHTSPMIPAALSPGPQGAPNTAACWHCHTSTGTTVTAFKNGQFHPALTKYSATPGGAVAPFPQPTQGCAGCHRTDQPHNIVEAGGAPQIAMDHSGQFAAPVTLGGITATAVNQLDCSTCHHSPGDRWSDGAFHRNLGGGAPKDCVTCHYPLMATGALADLGAGDPAVMKHRSPQLTIQTCDTCHTGALAKAPTADGGVIAWRPGAFHAGVPAQPASCLECHAASEPAANASTQSAVTYVLVGGATATNGGQWMNHGSGSVAGKDCSSCHAKDAKASGSAWGKSTSFHATVPAVTTCQECHGLTNGGGAAPGTKNNLPQGLTSSTTVSSAGSSPGTLVASGTLDQLTHADVNVAGRECSFCHLQRGASTSAGVQGKEWAQASFHTSFSAQTPLQMNGSTGRCSNCHLNLKPGAGYAAQDHSAFTAAPNTKDCASCHSWPGLGTPAQPDWKGAKGMPPFISVGGFLVTSPPAPAGTTQGGIAGLAHPTPTTTVTCLSCHATDSGGTGAKGYDHPPGAIDSNCGACHEPGSPLVATPWNGATDETKGAGDTRPFTLTQVTAQHGAGMVVKAANHFYPVDCNECHVSPGALGATATGPAYATTAWGFPHDQQRMTNSSTCLLCHVNGIPGAPATLVSATTVAVTELLPRYSGTSITSFVTQTDVPLNMSMLHSSADVPAAAMASCSNCHTGASAGNYRPGTLHDSLAALKLAEPSACASCHADALPAGFVGPTATAPARTPASGEMKHDAVSWSNGAPTTTRLVPANCALCHASPVQTATSWGVGRGGASPATYHPALAAAGQAQPGSCLDCHANTRPATVLTSANSKVPANVSFDHGAASASGDCLTCHAKSALAPFSSWSGGLFHLAGSTSPGTCVSCHAGERPSSTAGWTSASYTASPFDYGTNTDGITHGDGQDCASCHAGPGTGAWGGTQNWAGGHFDHASSPIAAGTCAACHRTQRPDVVLGVAAAKALLPANFDHSVDGTGECGGCHEATVAGGSYVNYFNPSTKTLPNGDWKGAVAYPGESIVHSTDQFVTVDELTLVRNAANLVTSTTLLPGQKLYNAMLHTAAALPAALNAGPRASADYGKCWHCHTSSGTTVTSYGNGQFHPSLGSYRATPGGTIAALPQPTTCLQCHSAMVPTKGLVERGGSDLLPMDHTAQFTATVTIDGQSVSAVSQLDCATCHSKPGVAWNDGVFHANIGAAKPADCVACHYPLMADPVADVARGASFTMKHRAGQVGIQKCDTCHTQALGKAAGASTSAQWSPGLMHANVPSQPTGCVDCHGASEPAAASPTQSTVSYTFTQGGTTSNGGQWLNHATPSFSSGGAVVDCVSCHASDVTASAWSKSTAFHPTHASLASCDGCHGLLNHAPSLTVGPANASVGTPGTNNNMPSGLSASKVVSSASNNPATGVPAGTHDQLDHTDYNVRVTPCKTCHTQAGASTAAGVQGQEWTVASFHAAFSAGSPLVMNATGRCSNCHLNLRPGPGITAQDHSGFTATSPTDCSSCHSWPGTGTASNPNWITSAVPSALTTGGFTIPKPPATGTVVQAPVPFVVPHPTVGTQACTLCHTSSAGGRPASAYDHDVSGGRTKLNVAGSCSPCHETGSPFVAKLWNGATSLGSGAGDTRPISIATLAPSFKGNTRTIPSVNHFYPTDCFACHVVPSGNGTATAYLTAWKFNHNENNLKGSCKYCHPPIPGD